MDGGVGVAAFKNIYVYVLAPAVVAQAYKVDVEVLSASRGCTAILRCVVPTFVKELVRVVSWVHEPAIYIYPSLQGGKLPGASFCRPSAHCQKPKGNETNEAERSSTQLSSAQSASASLSLWQESQQSALFVCSICLTCLPA